MPTTWMYSRRSELVLSPEDHHGDSAKLISALDLNMLRDVGMIINETVSWGRIRRRSSTDDQ